MRLIDADALDMAFTVLRFNDDKTLKHWGDRQDWCMSGQEVEDLINSAPTIEERKTGKWIERNPQNSDKYRLIECSECGDAYIVDFGIDYEDWIEGRNFCRRCGADLRGEADDR